MISIGRCTCLIVYLYFLFFQDSELNKGDIEKIVKAASIVQADEKNKNRNDYMIAIFYEKTLVSENDRLPTDFTHKIVTAVGYESRTAKETLPNLVSTELNKQPRVEHVLFVQDPKTTADISHGIQAAIAHERKPYLAFNVTNNSESNVALIKACNSANPKIGIYDARHNTSLFHVFKSGCSFTVSQRILAVTESGSSTIILPNNQASNRGNGKRRGGFSHGRENGYFNKRRRY